MLQVWSRIQCSDSPLQRGFSSTPERKYLSRDQLPHGPRHRRPLLGPVIIRSTTSNRHYRVRPYLRRVSQLRPNCADDPTISNSHRPLCRKSHTMRWSCSDWVKMSVACSESTCCRSQAATAKCILQRPSTVALRPVARVTERSVGGTVSQDFRTMSYSDQDGTSILSFGLARICCAVSNTCIAKASCTAI